MTERTLSVVVLLGLFVLSTALPVAKNNNTEPKKEDVKPNEEHVIKYDEGYDKDDPRNRPDVSGLILFKFNKT